MSIRHYILVDREPVERPLLVWAEWFERIENHIVRRTRVGPVEVSTVFLGLDHNWGEGAPLLFETMAWAAGGERSFLELQDRCSTWAEAEAQHERVCAEVREPGDAVTELWDQKERKYVEQV